MKKIFIMFCIVMATLFSGVSIFAAETDDSGIWEYQTYGTGVVLTKYTGPQTDVYVPSKIAKGDAEYPVLKLGDELFKDNTTLNSATLGEGVLEIGASAFEGATNLVCIVTPESLTTIEDNAFLGCVNFNSVILYDGVTSIGENAFSGCEKLVIYCNENTVAYNYAVANNIKYEILNPEASLEIVTVDGVEYHIMNGEAMAVYFDKSTETVTIPSTVDGCPVTCLKKTFYNCTSLTSVTLPECLQTISESTFYNCTSLTSITIPDSVTSIGNSAFSSCTSLTNITIPDSVTSFGSEVFNGCTNLTSITIPDSVTSIGDSAFSSCTNLTSITIPDSVTSFGQGAFSGCTSLTSITIPDSVTSIGDSAFRSCTNLTSITIPDSVTSFGNYAFSGCTSLKKIVIPKTVISMNTSTFQNATILCVYKDSYAHTFAVENNLLYFIIRETANPEISYGTGISGTVTYTDGTPASKIDVEILYDDGTVKQLRTTDSNGAYSFDYAEIGRYTIRATDTDGNTASEIVSVKRMNVFDVYLAGETDLVLKKGYTLSGTVSPSTAMVTLADTDGNVVKSVETTNGTFTFTDIPRGLYIVKAENENGSATTEIYVSNEDVKDIFLEIQSQSATITGYTKIENRDGTYSAKIWINVDLIDDNGNVVASTKTDAEGKYIFNNVAAGSYNIVATTTEMRPDLVGDFDKIHELKGYGHIDVTEFITYTVDTSILREDKINLTSVSGKVTTNAGGYVYISDESGNQISYCKTTNDGKFSFINIPDGVYSITAVTNDNGMGFEMISIENSVVYGNTNIKAIKANNVKRYEEILEKIPDEIDSGSANYYKTYILEAKRIYDALSTKDQKQVSQILLDKLNYYINFYSKSSLSAPESVTVENEESIISQDEIESEKSVEFVLTIEEAAVSDVDEDGITTDKEYETEKIKDKKGKDKKIAKYYDISFSKNGKNISNIQKQTETNGKLRITMDIPEEYRGHKHYSFIHIHKGEAVTLVDLDDDPNTVTFEVDKFSTFALAYSDVELVGDVEETIYPANITYNAETGKIVVSSTEDGTLYIATYNGTDFEGVVCYTITANATASEYDFNSNQAAFLWNGNLEPLCEKFTIEN